MGTTCGRAYWSDVARCATRPFARRSCSTSRLRRGIPTQPRQDLPDEVDGALLFLGRQVEHARLVRVGRRDEARVGVRDAFLRALLHLARVLDAALRLLGQRQRGPGPAVPERLLLRRVERELDLDHALEPRRIASGRARAALEAGQEVLGVELALLPARDDEAVAELAGHLRSLRPSRRDEDGHGRGRLVEDLGGLGPEVVALVRDVVVGPQLADEA